VSRAAAGRGLWISDEGMFSAEPSGSGMMAGDRGHRLSLTACQLSA